MLPDVPSDGGPDCTGHRTPDDGTAPKTRSFASMLGGTVSAGPSNPNAIVASCHGQTVSNLASNGNPPGHSGTNAGTYNKKIKQDCANYAP